MCVRGYVYAVTVETIRPVARTIVRVDVIENEPSTNQIGEKSSSVIETGKVSVNSERHDGETPRLVPLSFVTRFRSNFAAAPNRTGSTRIDRRAL